MQTGGTHLNPGGVAGPPVSGKSSMSSQIVTSTPRNERLLGRASGSDSPIPRHPSAPGPRDFSRLRGLVAASTGPAFSQPYTTAGRAEIVLGLWIVLIGLV